MDILYTVLSQVFQFGVYHILIMVIHVHATTIDYLVFSTGILDSACSHVCISPRVYAPCIDGGAYYQGRPWEFGTPVHDYHVCSTFQIGQFIVVNIWFLAGNDPSLWFVHGLIALRIPLCVGAIPGFFEEFP